MAHGRTGLEISSARDWIRRVCQVSTRLLRFHAASILGSRGFRYQSRLQYAVAVYSLAVLDDIASSSCFSDIQVLSKMVTYCCY